jgi:Cu-Zn family superoxide dismutase
MLLVIVVMVGAGLALARDVLTQTGAESAGAAIAHVEPTHGHQVRGTVTFTERDDGAEIEARLTGLAPGRHGLHVHERGDCSAPEAASEGPHFDPGDDSHGAPTDPPPAHHAGDLGNIDANGDGTARKVMVDPELKLHGATGVVGRAVIVHAARDDLESQPSGDAGPPVGCGVIVAAAE